MWISKKKYDLLISRIDGLTDRETQSWARFATLKDAHDRLLKKLELQEWIEDAKPEKKLLLNKKELEKKLKSQKEQEFIQQTREGVRTLYQDWQSQRQQATFGSVGAANYTNIWNTK